MIEEKPKVLIVDDMHPSIDRLLSDAGFNPDYQPEITPEHVYEIIPEYQGLIIRSKRNVDKALVDRAINLKFVARAGAGVDKVDFQYLEEKGIVLLNAPEGNRDALAEHTIGMLLTLFNKLKTADSEVRHAIWQREENRGMEVMGRTVGIYGYGFMGEAFAKRLMGFGCRIIAYDRYRTGFTNDYVEQVDLDTFQKETEILSIHVPLTDETRFLFDDAYFEKFTSLKVLLNTSRGEVVKLSAVNKMLDAGKLLCAGLDVLENEKLDKLTEEQQKDFDMLVNRFNVLLTPHVGGWTHESYRKINEVIVAKLIAAGFGHA